MKRSDTQAIQVLSGGIRIGVGVQKLLRELGVAVVTRHVKRRHVGVTAETRSCIHFTSGINKRLQDFHRVPSPLPSVEQSIHLFMFEID